MVRELNCNEDLIVLPSASRTATTVSGLIDNPFAKGVFIFLNITVASGTGGLTVSLQAVDPASGVAMTLTSLPDSPIVAIGAYVLVFYPGASEGSDSGTGPVSRTLKFQVNHQDDSVYTYSLGISLVR